MLEVVIFRHLSKIIINYLIILINYKKFESDFLIEKKIFQGKEIKEKIARLAAFSVLFFVFWASFLVFTVLAQAPRVPKHTVTIATFFIGRRKG